MCVGIIVNEFRDPPFDPVRVLVRLVLAGLLAWFAAWALTRTVQEEKADPPSAVR